MKAPLIALIAASSYIVPAIAGILRFKRLNNAMKVFLLFCFFACVEIGGEYELGRKHINNTFLSNYSLLIESAFIFTVYFLSIATKKIKQIISTLALIFLFLWIIDKIYFEIPKQLNDEMAVASRVFIIVISVVTIDTVMGKMNHPFIDEPIFWVATSSLIYSTGALLIVGLSNEILKMGVSYFRAAWYINWSLVIISNGMYTKGFFCTAKYQISYGL